MSSMPFDPTQALAGAAQSAPAAPPSDSGDLSPNTGSGITSSTTGDPEDDLRHALLFIQSYMEKSQDDQEIATVGKIAAQLQNVLATEAKNQDAALGVTPAHKGMRKAYQKSQGGSGGGY